MKREDILKNLCAYDPRNPDFNEDFSDRKTPCSCDNCHCGRTDLALGMIHLTRDKAMLLRVVTLWNVAFKSCITAGLELSPSIFQCLNSRYIAANKAITYVEKTK